jgi:trehalose 6-phosphate synthase
VPDALITHFTHIPWPSPAYWLLVPDYVRSAICRSLCQCDIVGFQSNRDARSFLTTCEEFVTDSKVDYVASTVTLDGHVTRVRAYPISIDPEELTRIAASPRTIDYERRLETLCLEKTIVRVDRLEPSKNVVRGFRAYELMLEQHPELHGTVTYLAFLAPSRTRVRQYQRYGDEVEEVVQRINRAYGTETWSPIHTFYENNYTQAVAGLKLYDVLVVNSVIDGMNLVAKEGPIVNTRNGVLVLSEAVGAHEQLRRGALSVSPTDIEGTANAMYTAVTMSEVERAQRAETLRNNVTTENVAHWLKIQAEDLLELTS